MIKQRITYGAAAAKIRGMHGKRLTAAQWDRLVTAASLRAVWDVLRECPAWQAVGEIPQPAVTGERLRQALMEQLRRDCHGLRLFLPQKDHEQLAFFLRHAEHGMSLEEYQRWWASLSKSNAALRRLAGAEADALNLVYILRLRRFPASVEQAGLALIPVRDKLKPELVESLLRAKTDEDAIALLAPTPWGKSFGSMAPGALEREYEAYMRSFCVHIMASADPGMGPVLAFLTLKEEELGKLQRLIGAVEQGVDPRAVL